MTSFFSGFLKIKSYLFSRNFYSEFCHCVQVLPLVLYPYIGLVGIHFKLNKFLFITMSQKRSHSPSNSSKEVKKKHWSMGLLDSMNDPSQHVITDDQVVVINDKYPKAMYHYLILPREKIASLKKLEKAHIGLLKHMEAIGKVLASRHPDSIFKMGYHAEPSMHHLHLHIISDDFVSSALKTKRHWNSFNTDHFILSSVLIKALEETDKPIIFSDSRCKELLDSPLRCHKCSRELKNMPTLKEHLQSHLKKT